MNSTSKTSNTPNRTVKKRLIPVLAAALLGSETQKVLTHSHFPVMVYR